MKISRKECPLKVLTIMIIKVTVWFFSFDLLMSFLIMITEKAMAPHSSTLAWKIPWMEEPGRLQSMESLRIRHDWATSLSLFTFLHWTRKWQPTPVFLPGESHGGRSLVGYSPWGRKESDTTEQLHFHFHFPGYWSLILALIFFWPVL